MTFLMQRNIKHRKITIYSVFFSTCQSNDQKLIVNSGNDLFSRRNCQGPSSTHINLSLHKKLCINSADYNTVAALGQRPLFCGGYPITCIEFG